jgi:Ser/Thr protein kinase RdoA (MazF antagonist)
MRDAGGLLARFHDASLRIRARQQRPGALPIAECRPSNPDARRIRARLDHELAEVGYDRAERGVVHGDATQANVVIDGDAYHLVDYALVAVEPLLFDIASALWRNGRTAEASLDYDAQRSAEFVRGYHAVRPIVPDDARAIIAYMLGRGLQIERRHELRQGHDATIVQRLLAVERQADELRDALARAVDGES